MTESKYGFSSQDPKFVEAPKTPSATPKSSPARDAVKDVLDDLAQTLHVSTGVSGEKLTLRQGSRMYGTGTHELMQVHPDFTIAEVSVTDSAVDLHFSNPASISEENKRRLMDALHQATGKPVKATVPISIFEIQEENARRLEADIKSGKVDPKNIFWGGHQAEYDE